MRFGALFFVLASCTHERAATVTVAPEAWKPFTCMSWSWRGEDRANACYRTPADCAHWRGERMYERPSSCVPQDAASCTRADSNDGKREMCFSNAEQCDRFRADVALGHGESTPCETKRF